MAYRVALHHAVHLKIEKKYIGYLNIHTYILNGRHGIQIFYNDQVYRMVKGHTVCHPNILHTLVQRPK